MTTQCAHCPKTFSNWRDYANHILKQHPDDKIRIRWAEEILNPTPVIEVQPRRRRLRLFRRKMSPLDASVLTPPDEVKTLNKIPKYIKRQYKDANVPLENVVKDVK